MVTIENRQGHTVYKDEHSEMPSSFALYWGWDDRSRAWAYSSDDGSVWLWEREATQWKKSRAPTPSEIPKFIVPEYAR